MRLFFTCVVYVIFRSSYNRVHGLYLYVLACYNLPVSCNKWALPKIILELAQLNASLIFLHFLLLCISTVGLQSLDLYPNRGCNHFSFFDFFFSKVKVSRKNYLISLILKHPWGKNMKLLDDSMFWNFNNLLSRR